MATAVVATAEATEAGVMEVVARAAAVMEAVMEVEEREAVEMAGGTAVSCCGSSHCTARCMQILSLRKAGTVVDPSKRRSAPKHPTTTRTSCCNSARCNYVRCSQVQKIKAPGLCSPIGR